LLTPLLRVVPTPPQADIYALGVLLWEMLAGQPPWTRCGQLEIAIAVVLLKQRLPLEEVPPERISPGLLRLISSMWDADPLRRPAAAEVVKTLVVAQEVGVTWGCLHVCGRLSGVLGALCSCVAPVVMCH
jgi:serine/threonine protein kinase